jgi:hypothetical protein
MSDNQRYIKETPRITVKFIDNETDETLFEIKDRNIMNVGEIFSDYVANTIIRNELKNKELPKSVLVIAVGEFNLTDD